MSDSTRIPLRCGGRIKTSIIIAVLESYEIVERQILHFVNIVKKDESLKNKFELIIVDDGSEPTINSKLWDSGLLKDCTHLFSSDLDLGCLIFRIQDFYFPFTIIETGDTTPWSQPRARNIGAKYAQGEYLFMTDIDHILTKDAIEASLIFNNDKMIFPRKYAILTKNGIISREKDELLLYGCKEKDLETTSSHANTFIMRKSIFCDLLNGYDEKFCGKHGGDDTDLNKRYGKLHYKGLVSRHNVGPMIYVYPDPCKDIKKVFHSLRRK